MGWVCVFRGTGLVDAYLARDWLEASGLTVQVRGDLTTIRGEIPIAESWPTVWVSKREEAAANEALRLMRGPRLVRGPWTCPACGEEGDPDLDACWQCDTPRPAEEPG
ncbi:MAG: DUF2007 domain-containing protein [Alphaproteobacteria bacterium]|nr:DUF2007 domain-containing protein [Alphaproteobacteria bacterium]MCB9698880.1 DUF2007 domain-containing protein [Alphaproteobacteria bacterium]